MPTSAPARTALASVLAAAALVAVKLVAGLATGSLGLIAEAVHSGTDLVAAMLTFLAIRVAIRPADRGHPFGHGKAEHLAALGEGTFLLGASLVIAYRSVTRLMDGGHVHIDTGWWVFAVLGVVIVIDAGRARAARRGARLYSSPALASNAVHFAADMVGSVAVVAGLLFVRAGEADGDSIAALVVAVLVVVAAVRLMRRNVQVLMDESPGEAEEAARAAIAGIRPEVRLRRLRMRHAAGRHFADVVIGVRPDAGVAQGHAVADAVERAVEGALPGSDVVVHVEPGRSSSLRERVNAAALTVRGVREIHNLTMLEVEGQTELSLHLKLPPIMPLEQAHAIASETERAIVRAVPEVNSVHTHIEPLTEPSAGSVPPGEVTALRDAALRDLVVEMTGAEPLDLRLREVGGGSILFLTLGMAPDRSLAEAHAQASAVEERIRLVHPDIVDVVVHTEPGQAVSGAL